MHETANKQRKIAHQIKNIYIYIFWLFVDNKIGSQIYQWLNYLSSVNLEKEPAVGIVPQRSLFDTSLNPKKQKRCKLGALAELKRKDVFVIYATGF